MKWFRNLKIGVKLVSGFGIILLLLVLIAGFSALTASGIDTSYSNVIDYPVMRQLKWTEAENRYNAIKSAVYHTAFSIGREGHEASAAALFETYTDDFNKLYEALNSINQSLANDLSLTQDEKVRKVEEVVGVVAAVEKWRSEMAEPMILALQAEDMEAAQKVYSNLGTISSDLMANIEKYMAESMATAASRNTSTTAQSEASIGLLIILAAATVVLGIVMAIVITNVIKKPVTALVKIVDSVSEGKLDVRIDEGMVSKDEIGVLAGAVKKLVETVLLIVSQLEHMNSDFEGGNIGAKIDESQFKGSYKDVTAAVNSMFGTMVGEILNFIEAINKVGQGDFKAQIANANSRTTIMVNTLDDLRDHLVAVTDGINVLVGSASEGNLDKQIDTTKYSGDWADLFEGLNHLMKVISAPINEASRIMNGVAVGNFDKKVEGDYQGAFLNIKQSLNKTIENIASYIQEISAVLDGIAKNNLNQNISREYIGEFSAIKESLNNIIRTFNGIVFNITMASDQVATGSRSISESSMSLAEGATEQAASIQELNATVQTISANTTNNAENAETAKNLSVQSKESASQGEGEMKKMLKSMDRIKESSNGISKIMKVINDIAFQTNLLALNAAVEAARAGEFGRGFAVVAEEVRTLAERSKENAQETTSLIEESINRVNEGMEIARNTDTALGLIVGSVSKVNEIVSDITTASQEQALAISQVTEGIQQIAGVIQNNSASSEETAAASQELSSQAEMLKGMVDVFTLSPDMR